MKLITFTVPCYNSEAYMSHCIDSLLSGGPEVEIIVIDDGSSDRTADIADEYALRYPDTVRAVHKENGGHGSGVNRGLEEASGLYFKVVDSDDWLDGDALESLLNVLRVHTAEGIGADLYITNFIYDHAEDQTSFLRHWRTSFPVNTFSTWQDAADFRYSKVLLMHALLYRTQALRESRTVLPEHTFYVDNLFAYKPLPFMKTIFYLDVDLYHYFIGREDQSVNLNHFVKRYDQQIRVMRLMADACSYVEIMALPEGLGKYMFHCLSAIMMNTMMFCVCGGDDENRRQALAGLWEHIREHDEKLYHRIRYGYPVTVCWLPWKPRGRVMLAGYKMLCRKIKLG